MSATIDERVVEMRFDNKQFESNAKTSLGTIDKLKQALNFSTSTKSFENLEKAAKGLDMGGLGKAVEDVKMKFSALEVMAVTALANIANRAVNAGIQLVKSLTVDQISAGFSEYELKMGSIQTIMASTGEDLGTVNEYLEELNKYADRTIYSFSDMTQNIGKFTNAGVKLESAVKAIQGVSNVAAVSGANANEASRAMYNFAQALSAGYVKLIDWKSIENANMATVEFKQSLLDTAVAMGTVIKVGDDYQSVTTDAKGKVSEVFNATKMFNDSLSSQWMTTEVLVQTLSNYSTDVRDMTDAEREAYEEQLRGIGYTEEQIKAVEELGQKAFNAAQDVKTFSQLMDTLKESVGSGWAQTFELIIGDFEEAKALWTVVNDEIGGILQAQSDARNELLKSWKDAGGRDALLEGIGNAWKALLAIIKPVKEAFQNIFPPATAETLLTITEKFKEFTSRLQISEETSDKLRRTFSGLFSVVDLVRQVIAALFKIISPGVPMVGKLSDKILDVTAAIGDWLTNLNKAVKENEVFTKAVDKIREVVTPALDKLKEFVDTIKEWVGSHFQSPDLSFFTDFTDTVTERFSPIKSVFDFLKKAFTAIAGVVAKVSKALAPALSEIGKAFASLGKKITDLFSNGNGFNTILDMVNSGALLMIGMGFKDFIGTAKDTVKDGGGLLSGLKNLQETITGTFGALKTSVLDTFTEFQTKLKSEEIQNIAKAIAILAASLVILALVDSDKLTSGIGAIGMLLGELLASTAAFEKFMSGSSSKGFKTTTALVALSAAVLILASALGVISRIEPEKLIASLGAITLLITEMTAVSLALSKYGGKIKTGALSMIAFAASIVILAQAIKQMAELDPEKLTTGLVGVGVAMAELAAFMAVAKFGDFGPGKAAGILVLSAALLVLQKAVAAFGSMKVEVLITGLTAVLAVLAELTAFSLLTGLADHVVSSSAAMVLMAAALLLLQKPMEKFGNMNLDQIGKGLLAMGGALAEVALALNLMPKNSVGVALGMIGVAAALTMINSVLMDMANLSWEEIAKSLVTLGLALTELAIAMNVMKGTAGGAAAMVIMTAGILMLIPALKALGNLSIGELVTALVGLAGAFAVIGAAGKFLGPMVPSLLGVAAAVALLSVGVLALSVALTSLSVGAVAAAGALGAVLGALIVGFLNAIRDSASAIGDAVKTIILVLCDVLISCVPAIVDTVLVIVTETLVALAEYTPTIVKALLDLLIGIINAIAESTPALIKSIVDLFAAIFEGVVDAFADLDIKKILEGIAIVSALMVAMAGLSYIAPSAMLGVLEMGLVIGELALVLAAIGALAQIPGLSWLIGEGGNLLQGVGTAIGKFIGGIVGGFMTGISAQFPQIGEDLSSFMTNVQPFLDGAKKIDPKTMDGVQALAETILVLTAANILDGLTSWFTGGSSLAEFGTELAEFGPYFSAYYESIKNVDGSVVEASASAATALAEMASKLPNQGGVVGWFAGENSLSVFAQELVDFGPAMKKYADSVKGIDGNVVAASADAATALAEMAHKLPDHGGVVGWFMGDSNLSDFAQELVDFGPAMKKYADSVKGLDGTVVDASAAAATTLAEMAHKLPNQGGVVGWFMGDNTLSVFGKELSEFGPYISSYAKSVSGLKPDVVEASANAALAMAEMATKIPNQGGLASWFSGDNSIASFGKGLKSFGEALAEYYVSISNINSEQLGSVIDELVALVNIARDVSTFNVASMSEFANNLKSLGNAGIDGFIEAFTGSEANIKQAISKMVGYAETAIKSEASKISKSAKTSGEEVGKSLGKGFENSKSPIYTSIRELTSYIITTLQNNLPANSMASISQNAMTALGNGFTSGKASINTIVSNAATSVLDDIKAILSYNGFYSVGSNSGLALANGILSQLGAIRNAGKRAGDTAIQAVRDALGIHSPSRVFTDAGSNSSLAFCGGLLSNIAAIASAGYDIANTAVDPVQEAITRISDVMDGTSIDYNPVITPVVDLSNVTSSADEVSSLFSGMDLTMSSNLASVAASGFYRNQAYSSNRYDDEQQKVESKLDQLLDRTDEDDKSVYYNTFNIQSTDPKGVADEVSYTMQHKVERGKAAWGKSSITIDPRKKLVSK